MMQDQAALPEQARSAVSVGFGERFVAYLIDFVILAVIDVVLIVALGPVGGRLLSFVVNLAYLVGFWTAQGATPGKMVLGLRVVKQDGSPLDGSAAALRYVGYIVSGLAIGLGFLWIIWDPQHEGWHDKIAKTRVIKG